MSLNASSSQDEGSNPSSVLLEEPATPRNTSHGVAKVISTSFDWRLDENDTPYYTVLDDSDPNNIVSDVGNHLLIDGTTINSDPTRCKGWGAKITDLHRKSRGCILHVSTTKEVFHFWDTRFRGRTFVDTLFKGLPYGRTRSASVTTDGAKEDIVLAHGPAVIREKNSYAYWIFLFLILALLPLVSANPSPPECKLGEHPICDRAWDVYLSSYSAHQTPHILDTWISTFARISSSVCWCLAGALIVLSMWRLMHHIPREYVSFRIFVNGEYVCLKNFACVEYNRYATLFGAEYISIKNVVGGFVAKWDSKLSWTLILIKLLMVGLSVLAFFSGFRRTSVFLQPQTLKHSRARVDRLYHWITMVVSLLLLLPAVFPESVSKFLKFLDHWLKGVRTFRQAKDGFEDADYVVKGEVPERTSADFLASLKRWWNPKGETSKAPTPKPDEAKTDTQKEDEPPAPEEEGSADEEFVNLDKEDVKETLNEAVKRYSNRPKDDFKVPNATTIDGDRMGSRNMEDFSFDPAHICTTCGGGIGLTGEYGCVCVKAHNFCEKCNDDCLSEKHLTNCCTMKKQTRKMPDKSIKRCRVCGEIAIYGFSGNFCAVHTSELNKPERDTSRWTRPTHPFEREGRKAEGFSTPPPTFVYGGQMKGQSMYVALGDDLSDYEKEYYTQDYIFQTHADPVPLICRSRAFWKNFSVSTFAQPFLQCLRFFPNETIDYDDAVPRISRYNKASMHYVTKLAALGRPINGYFIGFDLDGLAKDIENACTLSDNPTKADFDLFTIYDTVPGNSGRAGDYRRVSVFTHPDKDHLYSGDDEVDVLVRTYRTHVRYGMSLMMELNKPLEDYIRTIIGLSKDSIDGEKLAHNMACTYTASVCLWVHLGKNKSYNRCTQWLRQNMFLIIAFIPLLDFIWQITIAYVGIKLLRRPVWFLITTVASFFSHEETQWAGSRGRGRRKKAWRNSAGQEQDDAGDFHPDDDYESEEDDDNYDDPFEDNEGRSTFGTGRDFRLHHESVDGELRYELPSDDTIKKLAAKTRTIPKTWVGGGSMKPESLLGGNTRLSVGLYSDNLFAMKHVTGKYFVNGFRIGHHLFTVKHAIPHLSFDLVKNHKNNLIISADKVEDWGKDLVAIRVPAGRSYACRTPKNGEYVVLLSFGPQTFGKFYPDISYGVTDEKGFYTCDSVDGNCGGVVIAMSDGYLLGIHAAGSDVINYYEPFTAARLERLSKDKVNPLLDTLRKADSQMPINIQPQSLKCEGRQVQVDCNLDLPDELVKLGVNDYFNVVGVIDKKGFSSNQRKPDPLVKEFCMASDYVPPFDKYELTVTQAMSPVKGINHFARPDVEVREDALGKAIKWTLRSMRPHVGDSEVHTTFDLFDRLDKTTSAGYPYNVMKMKKADVEANIKTRSEVLHNAASHSTTLPMMQAAKEETRPTPKVDIGDQRYIWGGGMALVMKGLHLFENMHEKMHASSSGQWYSFVGNTIFYGMWEMILQRLKKHPNGWALDAKKWDASLLKLLLLACAWIRFNLLRVVDQTAENWLLILDLYRNLIYTVFLTPWGFFLMKKSGNPSGGPLTIHDNTIILLIVLFYCWIRLAPKEFQSLSKFREHVEMVLNGDDSTFTVSPVASVFFNGASVARVALELGVTFDTSNWEPRPAEDLDFLSATFYKIPDYGIHVPRYDTDKFWVSLYYTRHRDPAMTLTRALALYSIGYWDESFRVRMKAFIDWLIAKFKHRSDPAWTVALTGQMDDQEILKLYTGFETVGKAIKDQQARQKELYNSLPRQHTINQTSTKQPTIVLRPQSMSGKAKQTKRKVQKLEKEVKNLAVSKKTGVLVVREGKKNPRQKTNMKLDNAHKAMIMGFVKAELKKECCGLPPTARKMVTMVITGGAFGGRTVPLQRLMDQYAQPTAIVTTTTIIEIVGNGNAGSAGDKGKFGVMITASPGQSGWQLKTTSTNLDFTSLSSGTSTAFGKDCNIGCKAVYLDPVKVWAPDAAWDNTSWIKVPDSQSTELVGTFVPYTSIWAGGPGYENGLMKQGRTLAMSAYFRCSESSMLNGGNLAISRLTANPFGLVVPLNGPQTLANALLGTHTIPGNPMEWKNNAMMKPEVHTGLLRKGAYCWWMPPNSGNEPKIPGNMVFEVDPCIIYFSGQAAPDTAGNFAAVVGELEINTVYEFTTSDQFMQKKNEPYDPDALKAAYTILSRLPACMENDQHEKWISKMLKFLAGAAAGAAVLATGGAALPAIATGLATSKALFG